jgi:Glycosyl transferase family 2
MPRRREPNVAVITMARDEADMLPRWVAHYGRQVGVENLMVFDDNTVDGSTANLPCTVHRLPNLAENGRFERTRMELMSGVAEGLLAYYDAVVLADVDEFLIADPARYTSLVDFVAEHPDHKVMAPVGLNVVHHPASEGPLDPSRPVLGQRRFAKFVPIMCKPAIKRIPAEWTRASHAIFSPFEISPDLFMIHLKFHDRDELLSRANHRWQMVATDGRAKNSSWQLKGREIVARLDRMVAGVDADTPREFDARRVDLDIVRRLRGGAFRPAGRGQLQAMERQPLVRIPSRLHGLV